MTKKQGKFTVGLIKNIMLKTTLAMLPGTLAISGYNIVDTYFIGRLPGANALAAMGFTFPMIMLMGCLFNGVGSGIVTPMAHALGASDHKRAEKLVTYGFILATIIAVIVTLIGIFSCESTFSLLGAKGETLALTQEYMDIWFFGSITAALLGAGNGILIASGDSKAASFTMMTGLTLNVLLDPLFIFKFDMGIAGAALATILSQLFGAILIITLLIRKHKLLFLRGWEMRQFRVCYPIILQFAIPSILGMLLLPIGNTIMTKIVANFGDNAVAAVAAISRLEMIAFIIPMAMGMSVMPMIAQNYGAKLYNRISECCKFAMHFAAFFLFLMAFVFFFSAEWIAPKFSTVPEVQRLIAYGLKVIPWGLAGVEVHRFAGFLYTGTGHPRKAALLSAMRIFVFLIPLSLLALKYNSLEGTFYARLTADFLSGVIGYLLADFVLKHLKK